MSSSALNDCPVLDSSVSVSCYCLRSEGSLLISKSVVMAVIPGQVEGCCLLIISWSSNCSGKIKPRKLGDRKHFSAYQKMVQSHEKEKKTKRVNFEKSVQFLEGGDLQGRNFKHIPIRNFFDSFI